MVLVLLIPEIRDQQPGNIGYSNYPNYLYRNNYGGNFNSQNLNVQTSQGEFNNGNVNSAANNNQQTSSRGNLAQYPNYGTAVATAQSSAIQNNQGTGNRQPFNSPPWNFGKILQTGQAVSPDQNSGSAGIGGSGFWNGNKKQFLNQYPSEIIKGNSLSQANSGSYAVSSQGLGNVRPGSATIQQPSWTGNPQPPVFNQSPWLNKLGLGQSSAGSAAYAQANSQSPGSNAAFGPGGNLFSGNNQNFAQANAQSLAYGTGFAQGSGQQGQLFQQGQQYQQGQKFQQGQQYQQAGYGGSTPFKSKLDIKFDDEEIAIGDDEIRIFKNGQEVEDIDFIK